MKKLVLFILISLFILSGCQDDKSIIEPNNDYANYEMLKGRPILSYDLDSYKLTDDSDSFDDLEDSDIIIKPLDLLSKNKNCSAELEYVKPNVTKTKYSQTLTINGDKGGKVYLMHIWKKNNGSIARLYAILDIPIGAFKGILTFEIIFDLDNYAVELYPSPYQFDKPVLLSLMFEHIDLSDLDVNNFSFQYLDGAKEDITYKSACANLDQGMIRIIGAQLNHFSRYGWTRTTTVK
jgi:hypothetical protein